MSMKEIKQIFRTLADENRLRILKILAQRPLCVCEITNILGLATSTVSEHLTALRQTGFITEQKEGKWINYSLNYSIENPIIVTLLPQLLKWIDNKVTRKDCSKAATINRFEIINSSCKRNAK